MPKKLLTVSDELSQVIDHIADESQTPKGAAVEKLLWQTRAVKKAAGDLGIEKPERIVDARGLHNRKEESDVE